jgi:hypothetical protein
LKVKLQINDIPREGCKREILFCIAKKIEAAAWFGSRQTRPNNNL